jgi:hypothetical protein
VSVTFEAPDPSTVVEGVDYATSTFSDPWTFTNTHAFPTRVNSASETVSSAGVMTFSSIGSHSLDFVPYYPGSAPAGRDGRLRPINATAYNRIVLRMHSASATNMAITYATGDWRDRSKIGSWYKSVKVGWNTYELPLNGSPRDSTENRTGALWSGSIYRLAIAPVNVNTTVKLDWVRLTDTAAGHMYLKPSTTSGVTFALQLPARSAEGAGSNMPLKLVNGQADIPLYQLPPGAYSVIAKDRSGSVVGQSKTLTVARRPQPVIDTPSAAGYYDWASAALGNQWDMSSTSDLDPTRRVENASYTISSGVLRGVNRNDDPRVHLNDPQSKPINGTKWHRLTVRLRYDGAFGLNGGPTGGCVGRFIWYTGPNDWGAPQTSHDVVVYPSTAGHYQELTIDMAKSPSSSVVDEQAPLPHRGWSGYNIYHLRFDPNEDTGARHWYVDSVRLASDYSARGQYTIKFHDPAYASGETASIYVSRTTNFADAKLVNSTPVAMTSGVNSFTHSTAGLPSGTIKYYFFVKTVKKYANASRVSAIARPAAPYILTV